MNFHAAQRQIYSIFQNVQREVPGYELVHCACDKETCTGDWRSGKHALSNHHRSWEEEFPKYDKITLRYYSFYATKRLKSIQSFEAIDRLIAVKIENDGEDGL